MPDKIFETPIPGMRFTSYVVPDGQMYVASKIIDLDGAHDLTIGGKSIVGGKVPAINLTNCYNIHITANKLYNSTVVGIHLYRCKYITIDFNYFTNLSSGVYAEQITNGGIAVNDNQFLNMQGPFPRGQFIQFNDIAVQIVR